MISETITIPKKISESEDRFVIKLKDNLLRMIKEINRNGKKIDEIKIENEETDYTDEFNKKVNVDASNIGYGDLFIEKKDEYGEVTYSADDNRNDWGNALTNKNNNIAEDNVTLVSSQNVYNETHPYMDKDEQGNWINPYHYINYKNLLTHEDLENINKQDRWGQKDFLQPHEPNDNKVKENLIALDTAIWEVSEALDEKANISLNNINHKGLSLINGIAMESVYVRDKRELGVQNPLVKVDYQRVQDQQTGLYTDVYTVYSDYDPEPSGITLARLYKETRRFISGLELGPNKHYDKDSNNDPSYIDSGYDTDRYPNDYDPNITVARNVSNLNDGLISLLFEYSTLRNSLFSYNTDFKLGGDNDNYGTEWTLEFADSGLPPQSAEYEYIEDQNTHEKTDVLVTGIEMHTDPDHPDPTDPQHTITTRTPYTGQGASGVSNLKISGKVSLIQSLLKDVFEHEKYIDEHTIDFENLCQDVYGPGTTRPDPNSRYTGATTGADSITEDITNLAQIISGIQQTINSLDQRVTALEQRT